MLKIKDNIDLKKLELVLNKYDLVFQYDCNKDTGKSYISTIQTKERVFAYACVQEIKVYFYLNEKGILQASERNMLDKLDLLYDLIKADLVEKC